MWKGTGVIASTRLDSQGEQLSLEQLRILAGSIGRRGAIYQQHDMSLPVCGYMSNPRIEESQTERGEFDMVVDLESVDDSPPPHRGLSWSSTEPMRANCETPHVGFYLPYPLYDEPELAAGLLALDAKLLVGKWRKKAADPSLIALLVDFVRDAVSNATGDLLASYFLLQALPRLEILLAQARELWATRRLVTDIRKEVRANGRLVSVHLCPDRGDPTGGYDKQAIAEALARAVELTGTQGAAGDGAVTSIRAVYNRGTCKYVPIALTFESGAVTHLVDE